MKILGARSLDDLSTRARVSARQRQHINIHASYQDPCQRLFNAIEPGSYIQPHRHSLDPRDELLVAVRGLFALVTFGDRGEVTNLLRFGSEKHGHDMAVGAEVAATTWHTVVSLAPGSVLLEVKAGPFDPCRPKEMAPWAPMEGSPSTDAYLKDLLGLIGA